LLSYYFIPKSVEQPESAVFIPILTFILALSNINEPVVHPYLYQTFILSLSKDYSQHLPYFSKGLTCRKDFP